MANPADLTTPELLSTLSFIQQSTLQGQGIPIAVSTIYNPVILTMSELETEYSNQVLQETADRVALSNFFTPSQETLEAALAPWVAQGFPNPFVFCEITLNPPGLCSDGYHREFQSYFRYLTGKQFNEFNATFEALMPGISVIHSSAGNTLKYYVIKP
jgi:hypothetical protein